MKANVVVSSGERGGREWETNPFWRRDRRHSVSRPVGESRHGFVPVSRAWNEKGPGHLIMELMEVSVPEEHCGCGKGWVAGLWGFLDPETSEVASLAWINSTSSLVWINYAILFSTPPYPLPSFPVLPLTAIFFQVNMPTSVLGAHFPPWQSASWRNTPSRSTEKPWPSPGHELSVCSPPTRTTPPRKLPRPKK